MCNEHKREPGSVFLPLFHSHRRYIVLQSQRSWRPPVSEWRSNLSLLSIKMFGGNIFQTFSSVKTTNCLASEIRRDQAYSEWYGYKPMMPHSHITICISTFTVQICIIRSDFSVGWKIWHKVFICTFNIKMWQPEPSCSLHRFFFFFLRN